MAGRLAGVISKLLGSVFGDSSTSPLQKRIEWLRVTQDFHGGRYQVDGGGRSGQATVTGRNPGYRVGNVVPVVMDRQAPVAIVGHETLKAQFHPSGVAVEQVEELIMTRTSNPDGGLDHFLRSHRGLFYLDFRSAVAAVVPNPASYVDLFSGNRFPLHTGQFVSFGQRDNTISIFVASVGVAGVGAFMVIYVFKLNRPLHSDGVPTTGATRLIGGVEYPVASLTLTALYDLSQMSIPTGVSLTDSFSTRTRQALFLYEDTVHMLWDGFAAYATTSIVFNAFSVLVPVDHSQGASASEMMVIDFAHNNVTPSIIPQPYLWNLSHYYVDSEDRPVLVVNLENSLSTTPPVLVNGLVFDATGQLATFGETFSVVAGPHGFVEVPVMAVRLLQDTLAGGVTGELLGRTYGPLLSVSGAKDLWVNVPLAKVFSGAHLLGNHKQTVIRTGGGPADGTTVTWFTSDQFQVRTDLSGLSSPVEVGSQIITQGAPASYQATGAKPSLASLFPGNVSVIQISSVTRYVTLGAAPQYIRYQITTMGTSDSTPAQSLLAVTAARSRDGRLHDADVILMLSDRYGGWRLVDGQDVAVIYAAGAGGMGFVGKPNVILNRDRLLVEQKTLKRRLVTLDGATSIEFPDELGFGLGNPFSLVAPDRLYDKRESVGRFRSPGDPTRILSGPKPLPSINALVSFTLFLSTPPDIVHTVGTRTNKVSG